MSDFSSEADAAAALGWVFLRGEGWRPGTDYVCLFHKTFRTCIELQISNGRSFVFKGEPTGTTPSNTPGNTPRRPNKVKLCRCDGYISDWRFNAHNIVERLLNGEGEPLRSGMTEGVWGFKIQDPVEAAKFVFDRYDCNGDNDISVQELKPMLAAMGYVVTDEQVEEMLRVADSDQSGGMDFDEFCKMLNLNEAKKNMLVRSAESSAELWLTDEGFVYLAHNDKDEALVVLRGFCPDYTVQKVVAWMALGKATEAMKKAEHEDREKAKKEAEAQAVRDAAAAAQREIERLAAAKAAKEERRRQREAGEYRGTDALPVATP